MRSWITLVLAAALGLIALPAAAKDVRCVIKTTEANYVGSCRFFSERGGSFSVEPVGRPAFFKHAADEPGITSISVSIDGAEAEVRGLTTSGVNSRWGGAKRSKSDRACWAGADFSICAY